MSFLKEFDHLKIQMKDIVSATDNFDPARVIGVGGFGKVYRGELSSPEGQIKLAFKHLDRRMGQGNVEFWKEIMMLSEYKHENLISLRHFCIEGDEMILAYEYAPHGSLDRYLSDANTLTWIQRLKICYGAARGIHFLHDPKETNLRVLHRDIKSANILLDENWTAKVSDFGLSKVGPANQGHSYLVSNAVGTPGYCDPLYWESGCLSKESDVYSFGVVLFEILCGRLCFQYPNGELNILVPTWRQCYDEGRLDEIILPGLKEQMDPDSLESFSAIAYQCIMKAREERPTMAEIVQELENLLDPQVVKKTHLSGQKSTLEEIIKVIEDDNLQIVGLTGLGGVGKTTLASEVAATMNNQFSEIVFITVSQTVDSKMIQEKVHRAAKRIINQEKVLVILDDVWEELKLDELGIPCRSDYINCKILLTSRSTDVCKAMNAQKIIPVEPLKEGEAWTLFERVVDKNVWNDKLKEVALKIVQECGGLPLFVQAVGKALKNKKMDRWEAALRRLQDPTNEDAPFKRDVIMRLKPSYDYLESEAAKAVFLMCSMFPKDGGIYINELTSYVMALGIFNNLLSIEDAKCRVQLVVDSLQSSFLLQKMEEEEELYKMHDLVRDMALVITSKGNIKFMVRSGISLSEWQPRKDLESYNKISLMQNQICKLPDHELDFPHLDTFLIQRSFLEFVPDEFFRGMEKLKVLDMSNNKISTLPRSLKQLTELRTLNLSGNDSLCEISILGELTCLEILKLKWTGIKEIPEAIGKLTNLRLLDVCCQDLLSIAPGVISKLIRLEELYVRLEWDGNCDFLMELSELKSLKILHLDFPPLHRIPEDFHVGTLKEFHINKPSWVKANPHFRRTIYHKSSFPLTKGIMKLIQVSEMLYLLSIEDFDSILPGLYPEGFDELKNIKLMRCENVKSLVNTLELDAMLISNVIGPMKTSGKFFSQLEEMDLSYMDRLEFLWDSPHQYISFCNLVTIKVTNCDSLLKLFPLSVAQELVNLRTLDVSQCKNLEVVISAGDEETGGSEIELVEHIVLPLTRIRIIKLPNLKSFYSGHSTIKYPSFDVLFLYECDSMKKWSYGESHIPNIQFEREERSYSINDYITLQREEYGKVEFLRSRGKDAWWEFN